MGFAGSDRYLASRSLSMAVNAAIVLEKPLLIKGEPGTGKTVLAEAVAESLGADLISWHIKSTTKAQQGLYEYDAVARLRDSQLGDPRVGEIHHYIRRGKLWQAFCAEQRPVRGRVRGTAVGDGAPGRGRGGGLGTHAGNLRRPSRGG